ncbi:MAG: polyprenyl diphosphate synthase [Actinomycetota bacterium]|nr:di-trans,poly-cis-decaprenylcistransferase [Euzebyales bacterium]MDQ3343518.1 polyprenyl diphosphate synthase [Actinomycetota bacterium]MDQ3529362.1 polyprenyl diphosphate synthase [Actinomycetota bacterium]
MTGDVDDLDRSRLPAHVGIIMDGNGRWAAARGLPRNAGHEQGESALFDTVEGALQLGLRWLTVYAFSTENWKRPPSEVAFLLNFNRDLLLRRADELDERQVRVRFIGRRRRPVPRRLIHMIEATEARTARHRRLTLQVAFNYGGRAELVDVARRVATDVAEGRLRPDKVSEKSIQARLYEPEAPDVDLLVRTSGEQRLSNFLLFQAAYAELVFTDVLWPEFRRGELFAAVAEFQRRQRRFGTV